MRGLVLAVAISGLAACARTPKCDPPSKLIVEPRRVERPPLQLGGFEMDATREQATAACERNGGSWLDEAAEVVTEAEAAAPAWMGKLSPAARRRIGALQEHGRICADLGGGLLSTEDAMEAYAVAVNFDLFQRLNFLRVAYAAAPPELLSYVRRRLAHLAEKLGPPSRDELWYCTRDGHCGAPYRDPATEWLDFTLQLRAVEGTFDVVLAHDHPDLHQKVYIGDGVCAPH